MNEIRFIGTEEYEIAAQMAKALDIHDVKDEAVVGQIFVALSDPNRWEGLPRNLQERVKAIHAYVETESTSNAQNVPPNYMKTRALKILRLNLCKKFSELRVEKLMLEVKKDLNPFETPPEDPSEEGVVSDIHMTTEYFMSIWSKMRQIDYFSEEPTDSKLEELRMIIDGKVDPAF